MNSTSGTTTRAPSGSAAATRPTSAETWLPTATSAGPDADQPGERAPGPLGRRAPLLPAVRPPRQSASAACSASQAGRGGSP